MIFLILTMIDKVIAIPDGTKISEDSTPKIEVLRIGKNIYIIEYIITKENKNINIK